MELEFSTMFELGILILKSWNLLSWTFLYSRRGPIRTGHYTQVLHFAKNPQRKNNPFLRVYKEDRKTCICLVSFHLIVYWKMQVHCTPSGQAVSSPLALGMQRSVDPFLPAGGGKKKEENPHLIENTNRVISVPWRSWPRLAWCCCCLYCFVLVLGDNLTW